MKVVLIVDNINTKVIAPNQNKIDEYLYDMLSTPVLDGMKFTDAFQQGRSDGKIHVYYAQNHMFHTGLLTHVKEILSVKYEVTIIDNRKDRKRGLAITKWNQDFKLRKYQLTAVRKAMNNNGILQLPTGAGKSIIGANLIHLISKKACFIVHTRTLLYQTQSKLKEILNIDIGIIGDGLSNVKEINVCSIQTLYAVLSATDNLQRVKYNHKLNKFETERIDYDRNKIDKIKKMVNETNLVIFDEAHHISAETYTEVARSFYNANWRFGLTATAWREDKKEIMLHQLLGGIIYQITLEKLINAGYLVTPKIEFIEPVSMPGINNAKYSKKIEKMYFVGNLDRNNLIADKLKNMVDDGYKSILVIVQYVDHVKILEGLLLIRKIRSFSVTGSIVQKKREGILNSFKSGKAKILISTDIFGEGFDMPQIDAVLMAQMGKSSTKVFQYIGRSLRPATGKDHALIIDIADKQRWFGEWFSKRLGVYALEPIFRENMTQNSWIDRIDFLSTQPDIGEDRIILHNMK